MAQTGPKSSMGKRIASLNALSSGMNIIGFLPCKRERCFYWTICDYAAEYGPETLKNVPYGSPCPVELTKYEWLAHGYAREVSTDTSLDSIHELIIIRLMKDRQMMLSALEGGLVRQLPNSKPEVALSFRYRKELNSRFYRLMQQIFPEERRGEVWLNPRSMHNY